MEAELEHRIRKFENLHIPLWLVKDTCWMMEWKTLGVAMIVPTILMAIFITWKTRVAVEFFINLAICFWISANAFWMCCEFFNRLDLKLYAALPFALGAISCIWFYLKKLNTKS